MNRIIERIVYAYFEALFFTEAGEPDQELTNYDDPIPEKELEAVRIDVNAFWSKAIDLEYQLSESLGDDSIFGDMSLEQIGYDIWLTRNRHGTGFWDRGLKHGKELSKLAHDMGEVWPGLTESGQICDCASLSAYGNAES